MSITKLKIVHWRDVHENALDFIDVIFKESSSLHRLIKIQEGKIFEMDESSNERFDDLIELMSIVNAFSCQLNDKLRELHSLRFPDKVPRDFSFQMALMKPKRHR